jgi:hypothetical protein
MTVMGDLFYFYFLIPIVPICGSSTILLFYILALGARR